MSDDTLYKANHQVRHEHTDQRIHELEEKVFQLESMLEEALAELGAESALEINYPALLNKIYVKEKRY